MALATLLVERLRQRIEDNKLYDGSELVVSVANSR